MFKVYCLILIFVLLSIAAKSQLPTQTIPTQFSTGVFKQGWRIADSGSVDAVRDTFYARYQGTHIVRIQGGDTAFWFYGGNRRWFRGLQAPDTLSLSNRINLKLNTTDTTGKWWGIGKRWVDTVYRVNDSTIGFTINNGALQTFQILGRSVGGGGGGSGTVTSVALSMPSAFSVTGSPITTSGTFNISGAGTTAQYIRGNGTLATTDTGMIPNFHLKVRSLFSGTSPITYNSTTGAIGITNANASGTKGAATFSNSDFSDNGSGLISLSTLGSAGSCTGCLLNIDTKGRITGYADGPGGATNNTNIGAGFRILNAANQEMRTLFAGFGTRLDSVTNADGLTWASDTTRSTGLPTYFYVDSLFGGFTSENISNTALTADGNYAQNWNNKQWYVDSIASTFLFRTGGIGSTGTRWKGFRINWGGSSFGDNLDGYNIMSFINKADNSTDSLRLGLISSGSGTLSMGAYDVANSANNSFISYSAPFGLINISAKDSIWIKGAPPAASADSVLGLIHRSGGISKIVKIPFSGSGGGATLNNLGSGFRLVATAGGNIKTVFGNNTITIDSSSNTNALTWKVDTGYIATQYDLTQLSIPVVLNPASYAEQEANNQTYQWTRISNNTRFQWYDGVSVATVKDTLIMFGGWNSAVSNDSIFQSVDAGITWTFRGLLPYAVHTPGYIPNASDGFTYVIGGDYLNTNTERATVYRTMDFRTFQTMTTTSPFNNRVLHAAFELNGSLYVAGGQFYTLNAADGLFDNVYISTDKGVTWTQIATGLTMLGKNVSGCIKVFENRAILVDGGIYDNNPANKTFDSTVYTSVDGINWLLQANVTPYQGMQYPNLFVWDGKLWLSGGFGGTSNDNIDSTAYMDKAGTWYKYKPTTVATETHAAATFVYKDQALQILGNNVNEVWQLKRGTEIFFNDRPFIRTGIGIDSLRRNSLGYNIDAYSTTNVNENRYTNSNATNEEHWLGSTKQLYNNSILTFEFPASGNFYAKKLLGSSGSTTFPTGTYYSNSLATSENFPGIAWVGGTSKFVIGLDGYKVGFRREDGGTNGIRFKHAINNGQSVFATNTTNNYDVDTVGSAAVAILSTTHGFLPPKMTGTERNAIIVGRVKDLTIVGGSSYTNGTYAPVPFVGGTGTGATASITVSGNAITAATVLNAGANYKIGDVLTVNAADVGGTGSGASFTINSIPEGGLMIFNNSTYKLNYYNGSAGEWKVLVDSPATGSATTIYNGDGSIGGNRIVTGSNNDLTFATMDIFRVNSNYNVWAKNDASSPYTSTIGLTGANYWQFAYTPSAGSFTRGNAIIVDTLNNTGLGDVTQTSMPLYATGNSTYIAAGLQSKQGNFYAVTDVSTNTTLGITANFVTVDATSGNVTITLPAASASFGSQMGYDLVFKRLDNSGNSITIQRAGSDLIDGANSFTLTTQYEAKKVRAISTSAWAIY